MKKIATTLVVVLGFGTVAPYFVTAESSNENINEITSQTNNNEISNDSVQSEEQLVTELDTENIHEETLEGDSGIRDDEELIEEDTSIMNDSSKDILSDDSSTESIRPNTEANEENTKLPENDTLIEQGSEDDRSVFEKVNNVSIEESKTSKLGHIRNGAVKIFKDLNSDSFFLAGSTYTNTVYYIKKQAVKNNQVYYLISKQPSSINGVVGWIKSGDMSVNSHTVVDKKAKAFYVKGTGSAYEKAWGGKKDLVYTDLSVYEGNPFVVNLTEKVGNTVWYRGTLNGKTVWIQPDYLVSYHESDTSLLGHIKNRAVKIYKTIGNESTAFQAEATYTNAVYYIKKQTVRNGQTYYLISKRSSSTNGVVGWVKSGDVTVKPHTVVDKQAKTFYVKGTGSAYEKAWGGKKDLVYSDLSVYKTQVFNVHLTEKAGTAVWYRGTLNGKTVWIHSDNLVSSQESNTSLLGHIQSSDVRIYETIGNESTAFLAGATYMNAVYYIKKQALINGQTYYLISKRSSSTNGVVGWVKSGDMTVKSHTVVDKQAKTFYVKGTGSAYEKAWGGKKDLVYSDLSAYKNQVFDVHLTEKAGTTVWYRGTLNGKTVWIEEADVRKGPEILTVYSNYNLSLSNMLEIQLKVSPQTDKRYKLWVREDAFKSISNGKGTIGGDNWNLRRGPGTIYLADGKVNDGDILTIYSQEKDASGYTWYHVKNTSGWVVANPEDVSYYLNPSNFLGNLKDCLQFVKLSESANVNVKEVNEKILSNKGVLTGRAQDFIDGAKANDINEIYLISHALLETGNGTSELATGVEVGRDSKGNLTLVNANNRGSLTNIKTTYNMYGIGAYDDSPLSSGAIYAYKAGWFSVKDAIIGGASFIGDGFINKGQDTLYKMRWNPYFASKYLYASHQYATDIGWAYKQTSNMYKLYQLLDNYSIVLDIPKYK